MDDVSNPGSSPQPADGGREPGVAGAFADLRFDRPPRPPLGPRVADTPPSPPTTAPPPVAATSPGRHRRGKIATALVGIVALVAAGVGVGFLLDDDAGVTRDTPTSVDRPVVAGADTDPSTTPIPDVAGPISGDAAEPVAAVAEVLSPSVVRIDTDHGTGSGVIYDAAGLIVTNAHVVAASTQVRVLLADGTRVQGDVVGFDAAVDVGVVRIGADDVPRVATFAPASSIEVGQLAVAIGSPFGLEQSVTAGIVSAVNRVITNTNVIDGSPTVVEMVQTDAPINPGNSGGALADRQGRVIGMNTSIRTDGTTQGSLGVGFAIPSDTVLLVAGRIVSGDPLDSGFLGISGEDPTIGRPGALVTSVVNGGPAADAGVEVGDLVVGIDGDPVITMAELAARVRLDSPGTEVELEIIRGGDSMRLTVVLGTVG